MPVLLKKIKDEYTNIVESTRPIKGDKLYIQIYKLLYKMIIKTEIPDSFVLPPTRILADTLGVSRSTIIKAYDILILDGLVVSKRNSGYQLKPKESNQIIYVQSNETNHLELSKIGKSFLELADYNVSNSAENLAFSPGLPPLDIFPISQWKNLTNMYWKEIEFANLAYSPSSGIEKLKSNVANYLALTRNIQCNPSQVFIVSGSMQSLFILSSILLNPGENVILEEPTFPNVHAVFKGLLANILVGTIDKKGINVDYMREAKHQSKLIHVTPSCQYPLGIIMPSERREELLQFADENQSYIIENDYEHELNNWEKQIPSIFSLDKRQKTIYLGTFNRILHPSLRIGYIIVPQNLKLPFELMLKHSHRFVSPSIQFVLNQFIERKVLHNHLNNLIAITKERKLFFHDQFNEIFKGSGLSLMANNTLSLQSLVKIKGNYLDKEIVDLLSKNNISVHSFNKCFNAHSPEQGLIFGHCSIAKPIIKNKLIRINSIFQEFQSNQK